ncbi:hypothetical protein QNM99_13840 [Pseudomonas sp. PCH446]
MSTDTTLALTTVRTFLCLLNNLPAWTEEAGLDAATYRGLMHNIALGAVKGALAHPCGETRSLQEPVCRR